VKNEERREVIQAVAAKVKNERLRVAGMSCVNCQKKIEKKLRSMAGVRSARASHSAATVEVCYDAARVSLRDIDAQLRKLGYSLITDADSQSPDVRRVLGVLLVILSLFFLLQQFGILNLLVPSQLADTEMGYGMLFLIGLITSLHCVAMCGGINLSQCLPREGVEKFSQTFTPALLYNLGRVLAYSAVGFVLGLVGFVLGGGASGGLPTLAQGLLKLIAGALMVVMGLNMLGLFPVLRKLQPRIPEALARRRDGSGRKNRGPLFVGLLNGLMPCGPLQSMQIVALASGNPLTGALSMFLFSLGTVPLMLGLGSLVSALGRKFAQQVMNVGAVLVVVLGLALLAQGGSLSGLLSPEYLLLLVVALAVLGLVSVLRFKKTAFRMASMAAVFAVIVAASLAWTFLDTRTNLPVAVSSEASAVEVSDGRQLVSSTLASGRYPDISVRAGIPVAWTIDAPQGTINGCNNRMIIRDFGVEHAFKTGENLIQFTPKAAGKFSYSCWMGMIRGTITVLEE
jgi:sulfite exporter TauE/SafE/copper chaperone CopZ